MIITEKIIELRLQILDKKLNSGLIKEDKDADLVVLDKDYNVCMTIVKGKVKYTK